MNFVVVLLFCLAGVHANINFKAKFMGNLRVSGDSIVVHAMSVSHCLAMCNKNASCDAITYDDKQSKCRLFKRCVPLHTIEKSIHYWFYAKRPPVSTSGYQYENRSDSCLAVKVQKITYEDVSNICAEDRAYPAVLNTRHLLEVANHVLHQSGENEAWINPPYRNYQKFAQNRGMQSNSKILLREENGALVKECWSLQKGVPMKVNTCAETTKYTICQLPTY